MSIPCTGIRAFVLCDLGHLGIGHYKGFCVSQTHLVITYFCTYFRYQNVIDVELDLMRCPEIMSGVLLSLPVNVVMCSGEFTCECGNVYR